MSQECCKVGDGKPNVLAAAVGCGGRALHDDRSLQNAQVMGEQVRCEAHQRCDLARGPVAADEEVGDGKPDGVAERGVYLRPADEGLMHADDGRGTGRDWSTNVE